MLLDLFLVYRFSLMELNWLHDTDVNLTAVMLLLSLKLHQSV